MSILYLNCGSSDILTKKEYLLSAAESLDLKCIRDIKNLEGSPLPPEYVLNIQPYSHDFKIGTKWVGSWEIECLILRDRLTWWWNKIDTVFLANRMDWLEPKPKKVRYLMQACLPELYDFDVKQEYDLVQIGTMSDLAYFKDFGIKNESTIKKTRDKYDIYKPRRDIWEKLKAKYNVFVFDGGELKSRAPIKDYLYMLSKGKIQFIRSMEVMGEGEIAQRFFESLPLGPVLTNYAQDLDHLKLTPDGDYCVYHSEQEMFDKIDELLKDDALRSDIARHGREKALKEHTFQCRLLEIIEFLENHYGFRR